MLYSDFKDKKLPQLGFGVMRMPTANGGPRSEALDMGCAEKMFDRAMEAGVNYFDTGWDYHAGTSETALGRFLSKYPRESYMIADKFPGYDLSCFGKTDEIFEQQLERCAVERFDFYLLHNVCELNIEQYLDAERYGTVERILELKEQGLIDHFGISTHGNLNTLRRFLRQYGDVLEICQIQLNWLDWEFQDAREKVALLASYGIPVIVMEPLRGGTLATLSDEHLARLGALRPDVSAAEWGFRFLQGVPEVVMTLSGVSNMEQLDDGIRIFSESKPPAPAELEELFAIAREKVAVGAVPCTSCRYCTTHCPEGLDIPGLITLWNEHSYTGQEGFIAPMALGGMPASKRPSACIGCRTCESFCPQQIEISKVLHRFATEVGVVGE